VIEHLFGAEADRIYRYARFVLGSRDEAKDVVQSTFLKAVRSWPSFRAECSPETWLWTIVRSVMRDRLRSLARQRRGERLAASPVPTEQATSVSTEWQTLILGLPVRERQVVVLSVVSDLPAAEVATRLDLSPTNVRVIRHRALERLRRAREEGADS